MYLFLGSLFSPEGFVPRWECGNWSPELGWLHIISDTLIGLAYMAIPAMLVYFVLRRHRELPFHWMFLMFGLFILACGLTHLMEVIVFYAPLYRLSGGIKLVTALVSWGTVLGLAHLAPRVLAMRTPEELERLVRERTAALEAEIAEHRETEEQLRQQREWFRVTLASIGDAVIVTDSRGQVRFVNPVAEELTGWHQQEAMDRPLESIFRLICEQTRDLASNPVTRAIETGAVVGLANHTALVARDGTERPIDDSAAPIRDAQGNLLGVVLVFRDVAARRTQENTLRDAIHRKDETLILLDSLLANAPVGFAFFDRQHCYFRINQFLADLDGLPVAAHLGHPLREVLPATASAVDPVLEQVFTTGQGVRNLEIEGETPAAPGVRRHWLAGFYPVAGPDGAARLVGAVVMEITAQKRAESALREADRRKDEFLAMLAHELRNPLAPVRNALAILRMPGADERTFVQAREMMERQVQHLVRLVDDLLDVSRINRGKIHLRKERVELATVIERAVETARPVIDALGHQLTVTLPPEPVVLEADLTRLAQVVANLLNNAAKYTDRAGKIWLTALVEGGALSPRFVTIHVRDTGIGIAAEMLPHVFDLFAQADRSLERAQGGLGIGLTLVRHLVEMHGGTVSVQSEGTGQGAEFVVRLPLPSKPPARETEKHRPHAAVPGPTRRVLVVDDNVDAAESLGLMLRLWGHEIRLAHNGLEALEEAARFRPDLVLLDIGLPEMDGYEVARQLRQRADMAQPMLVAVTGYGQEEDRRRSLESGCDLHLTKPVDPSALAALLTLGRHRDDAGTLRE